MRNPLKWFIVACTTLAIAVPAMAQPVKIGFINLVRIEREAKRPQRDAERLLQGGGPAPGPRTWAPSRVQAAACSAQSRYSAQ